MKQSKTTFLNYRKQNTNSIRRSYEKLINKLHHKVIEVKNKIVAYCKNDLGFSSWGGRASKILFDYLFTSLLAGLSVVLLTSSYELTQFLRGFGIVLALEILISYYNTIKGTTGK